MLSLIKKILPYRVKVSLARKYPKFRLRVISLLGDKEEVGPDLHSQISNYLKSLLFDVTKNGMNRSGKKRRLVAVFSPSIETNSGIAWYTKNLIESSSDDLYFHWYSTSISSSDRIGLPDIFSSDKSILIPIEYFENLHLEIFDYSELVFMLGNGKTHNLSFKLSRTHEGIVVVHDLSVPSVTVELDSHASSNDEFSTWKFPRKAKKYIFHSKFSLNHFLDFNKVECSELKVVRLPAPNDCFELIRKPEPDLFATFGFISYDKEPFVVVQTFLELSRVFPDKTFAFIGPIDASLRDKIIEKWITSGGVEENLVVSGPVTRAEWLSYLSRTIFAIQLRTQTNGESSATVSELMAAKIPSVVTNIGTFCEIENDHILKVDKGVKPLDLATQIALWSKTISFIESKSIAYHEHGTYAELSTEIFSSVQNFDQS